MGGFLQDIASGIEQGARAVRDVAEDIETGARVGREVVEIASGLPRFPEREATEATIELGGVTVTTRREQQEMERAGIGIGMAILIGAALLILT